MGLVCFLAFTLGTLAKGGVQLVATAEPAVGAPALSRASRLKSSPKTKNKKILKADNASQVLVNSEKSLKDNGFKFFIKSLKEKLLATNFKDFRLLAPFVSVLSFILARKYILNSNNSDNIPSDEEKNKEIVTATSNNNLGEEYEKLKADYNNLKVENEGCKKLKEDYDTLQKKFQDLLKNNDPSGVVNLKNKADGNKGTYFLLLILFTTSLTLAFYTRVLYIKNKHLSKEALTKMNEFLFEKNKKFSEETLAKGEVIERHRQVEDCMSTFLNTYLPRLESKGKIFEDENPESDFNDRYAWEYGGVFSKNAHKNNKKFIKALLKRVYDDLWSDSNLCHGGNFVRNKLVKEVKNYKDDEFFKYLENKLKKYKLLAPKDEKTGKYSEFVELSFITKRKKIKGEGNCEFEREVKAIKKSELRNIDDIKNLKDENKENGEKTPDFKHLLYMRIDKDRFPLVDVVYEDVENQTSLTFKKNFYDVMPHSFADIEIKADEKVNYKVVMIELNKESFPEVEGICRDEMGVYYRFKRSFFDVVPTKVIFDNFIYPGKCNLYALPVDWGEYNEYFRVVLPKFYAKIYTNGEKEAVKKRIVEGFLLGKDDFECYENEEREEIEEREILERAKFLLIPLMYKDEIEKEYRDDFFNFMKEYIIKGNEGIFERACVGIPGAEEFCKSVLGKANDKNKENKIENGGNNNILNGNMGQNIDS